MTATSPATPGVGEIADGPYRFPPGPPTPGIVNLAAYLFARRRATRVAARRFGDAFTVTMPMYGDVVVVSSPELVKAVFTAAPDVLTAGNNRLGRALGPGSLRSMDGERHLKERRMLLPPFHGDRMRAYDSLIEEESLEAFALWPDDEELASIEAFRRITMGVILRAVFGARGPQRAQLEEVLARQMALGQMSVVFPILRRDFGRWSPGRMLANTRRRYDQLVDQLIDERLADPDLGERIDILAFILRSLQEEDEEINRSDLADELLTLLVAGSETTASSLAWAVERLTRHPDVLRRLEAEAERDSSALRDATILEVLRTRPAIMSSGRRVKQPFELGPWRLPVGTVVMVANSTVQEDDRFHARAHTFDPDRYVGRKPDIYSWVPFGGGVRRCIGASFAHMEMDVVLRTMLRHFELLPTTARPEGERFRGVAHTPSKGGRVRVRRRGTPLGGGTVARAQTTQPTPASP